MALGKEIEIIIDEEGKVTAEAFNYKGKGCAEDIGKILNGLGSVVEEKKKHEYFDDQNVRERVI